MTLPRCVVTGTTYLLTRRCTQRRLLLVPRGPIADFFGYCVAVAAERHSIALHAIITLSNHWHCVATDPHGRISDFARDVHSWVAKTLNTHLGRWENVWSSDRLSLVELVNPEDTLKRLVYTTTNAVRSGLVETASDWPGLRSLPADILHRPRRYKRPKRFFLPDGPTPDEVELRITVPPHFVHLDDVAFVCLLEAAVAEREASIHKELEAEGRTFMGPRAVKRQRRDSRPKTHEPRRTRNPTIACRDKPTRIAKLAALVTFRQDYRAARRRWLQGEPLVDFPAGTLLMATYPNIQTRPPPTRRQAA